MDQILKILIVILFFSFLGFSAQAANASDVVINEIAWMGTTASYNDEWIELKNNTDQEINLYSWVLRAADGSPEIKLARTVLANGFYLLERTDDNTVPEITADQIYTGALNNAGENLGLYDNLGNLIDSVDASAGWPAGDNATKQTMERINDQNWGTSQNPDGTPKAKNSVATKLPPPPLEEPSVQSESQPEPESELESAGEETLATSTPAESPLITYPSGIVINEILPSPTGSDEEEEWIEIFNQNNFEVNLSDWQITDTIGSIKIYTFPEGTIIEAKGFLILSRPATKITLNNSGDGLNLIQPNGKIIDSVTYEKAPRGQSYNRLDSGWVWSTALTSGDANVLPPSPVKFETEEPTPKKELAAIGEQMPTNLNTSLLFLVAIPISLFGGVIILVLKKKLKLS